MESGAVGRGEDNRGMARRRLVLALALAALVGLADGVNLRTTVDFWAAVQEQSGPDYEEQGKPGPALPSL